MANTTNNFTNPFNLPPAVQITLPLSVARNLLTLLEECASTWSVDTEAVTDIRHEYTNEMIRHGIIRASERSQKTPEQQAFTDAAAHMSQEDWDADNAWLESAGWGEM